MILVALLAGRCDKALHLDPQRLRKSVELSCVKYKESGFGEVAAVLCFMMAHTERARRRCLRGSFLSVSSYQQSWFLCRCGSKHQQLCNNFRLPDDGLKNLARLYIAPTEAVCCTDAKGGAESQKRYS